MIILDTSIAIKWILPGEIHESIAKSILEDHLSTKQDILVPDLFYYEIANTLATKTSVPSFVITRSLNKIYDFNLKLYHPQAIDVLKAARLSKKYATTTYDMLYAVIAKSHQADLITADSNFVKKTGFKFVHFIGNYNLN